jgi:hypothetical protein
MPGLPGGGRSPGRRARPLPPTRRLAPLEGACLDGQRFDDLTRALATVTPRRRVLAALLGGGLAALGGRSRVAASCPNPPCTGCGGFECGQCEACGDGACEPRAAGTPCAHPDPCVVDESCDGAGACVGTPRSCPSTNPCQTGTCDTSTGNCVFTPRPNNAPCGSRNFCRFGTCVEGCVIGGVFRFPGQQNDANQCQTCQPATSTSTWTNKSNGTACTDRNACTRSDTCQNGVCTGGNPVVCTAQDQCHDAGTCDPATGLCSNPNKANGTPCNDGNACTTGDTCQAGVCTGGAAPDCDDGNPCTTDSCDPAAGCVHANVQDGAGCAGTGACAGGVCVCPAGTSVCGDVCVNLKRDRRNCGECGKRCRAGRVCRRGRCRPA